MGSLSKSLVSGPGVDETKAIWRESGDHAIVLPVEGSGLFVPFISCRKRAPEPSARATHRPPLPPNLPSKAIHLLSGDHVGLPPRSSSPPTRELFPSAMFMIQIWA